MKVLWARTQRGPGFSHMSPPPRPHGPLPACLSAEPHCRASVLQRLLLKGLLACEEAVDEQSLL